MRNNGIVHETAAPYHPSSNGLAERAVQTFKEMMKKSAEGSLLAEVSLVLFSYIITPHMTLFCLRCLRKLHSILDLLHPDLNRGIEVRQRKQKDNHDKTKNRGFRGCHDKEFQPLPKWIPGFIVTETSIVRSCWEMEG